MLQECCPGDARIIIQVSFDVPEYSGDVDASSQVIPNSHLGTDYLLIIKKGVDNLSYIIHGSAAKVAESHMVTVF